MRTETIAVIISSLSLLVSLLAFWTGWRALKIEKDRRRDEKSAQLIVQFRRDEDRRVLTIWNNGNGEARNIRLRIDGQDATEHPCWLPGKHPVSVISGGNHADFPLSVTMRSPVPKEAEVFWDDDVCQGKSGRGTLTL